MTSEFDMVEILLVEDNPTDAELSIRALRKHNLADKLLWVRDGVEALDFLFREGVYAHRKGETLKVVLLDLRLPKIDGMEVLRRVRADSRTKLLRWSFLRPRRRMPTWLKAITSAQTALSASLSASMSSPMPWRNSDCTGCWSTGHQTVNDRGRAGGVVLGILTH